MCDRGMWGSRKEEYRRNWFMSDLVGKRLENTGISGFF